MLTLKNLIAGFALLIGFGINGACHPVVDSFINTNACFFVEKLWPIRKIENFKLVYKDRDIDSSSVSRAYKSYYWVDQCNIFDTNPSKRKEDITDWTILGKSSCNPSKGFKRLFSRKEKITVLRIPPYKEGVYSYYYYVLHYGNSYMNVVFKLQNDKIVRFCYYLAIT